MWVVWAVLGFSVLCFIIMVFYNNKVKKNLAQNQSNLVDTKDARFTKSEQKEDLTGDVVISYVKGDMLLKYGVEYKVGNGENKIKPGKYIILSTNESKKTFGMRIGPYVQNFEHNTTIVFTEGEEVTPVSISVILR